MRRTCLILLSLLLFCGDVGAAQGSKVVNALTPPGSTLVGTVPISSGSLSRDRRAREALQELIPVLLTIGAGKMVRLEGHAGGGRTRADYVKKSLLLAQEVERYLRVEQKVSLDLYLAAADDKIPPRQGSFVRIVVYPQEFREKPGMTQVIGE